MGSEMCIRDRCIRVVDHYDWLNVAGQVLLLRSSDGERGQRVQRNDGRLQVKLLLRLSRLPAWIPGQSRGW